MHFAVNFTEPAALHWHVMKQLRGKDHSNKLKLCSGDKCAGLFLTFTVVSYPEVLLVREDCTLPFATQGSVAQG